MRRRKRRKRRRMITYQSDIVSESHPSTFGWIALDLIELEAFDAHGSNHGMEMGVETQSQLAVDLIGFKTEIYCDLMIDLWSLYSWVDVARFSRDSPGVHLHRQYQEAIIERHWLALRVHFDWMADRQPRVIRVVGRQRQRRPTRLSIIVSRPIPSRRPSHLDPWRARMSTAKCQSFREVFLSSNGRCLARLRPFQNAIISSLPRPAPPCSNLLRPAPTCSDLPGLAPTYPTRSPVVSPDSIPNYLNIPFGSVSCGK